MAIDAFWDGVLQVGVPPLKEIEEKRPQEMPQAAQKIIEYVEKQAKENGINLQHEYRKGEGAYLRKFLNRTGSSLNTAYGAILRQNEETYKMFVSPLERIIDLLGDTELAKRNVKRKHTMTETYERKQTRQKKNKRIRNIDPDTFELK